MNRDLKPENLLLKRKIACQDAACTLGNLRCVDFGSAAIMQDGAHAPSWGFYSFTL